MGRAELWEIHEAGLRKLIAGAAGQADGACIGTGQQQWFWKRQRGAGEAEKGEGCLVQRRAGVREGTEGIWIGAKTRSSAKHTVQECQQTPHTPSRSRAEERERRAGEW